MERRKIIHKYWLLRYGRQRISRTQAIYYSSKQVVEMMEKMRIEHIYIR